MKALTMLLCGLSAAFTLAFVSACATKKSSDEISAPADADLVAIRTSSPVSINDADADVWADAPEFTQTATGGEFGKVKITLQAMHDGEFIYIRAGWDDATKSDEKGVWLFDAGEWSKQGGNEDRLAFAFNVSSKSFDTRGCGPLCHDPMHTESEEAIVDVWHWKAARGGQNGYCDDQYFGHDKRHSDDGDSAYEKNINDDRSGPKYSTGTNLGDGGITFTGNVEIGEGYKAMEGEKQPGYVVVEPTGSRADISAMGHYSDGRWTVILKRKLNTGDATDAVFTPGKAIGFAVALFDDCGDDEHDVGKPANLWLEK